MVNGGLVVFPPFFCHRFIMNDVVVNVVNKIRAQIKHLSMLIKYASMDIDFIVFRLGLFHLSKSVP